MKKIKLITIILAFAVSLVACGNNDDSKNKNETKAEDKAKTDDASKKDEGKEDDQSNQSSEVSYDSLMAMEPSAKEDFNVQKNKDGGLTVTGYVGKGEMVYIPDEIDGTPVTEISKYTFANNNSPKAVKLGENIKLIEESAFANNDILEIFVAGESLEKIDRTAFLNVKKLNEVHLNEGLKEIGSQAFSMAPELKELTIPNSLEKYGSWIAFKVNDNFVLKGKKDSKAEEIAKEIEVKYEEIK